MGTPNASNQSHDKEKPQWELDALRKWGVEFRDTSNHSARSFLQADLGDSRSIPRLAQLAADVSVAPIWRANAMEALGSFGGREALQSATQLLYSDDSVLRVSTVRAIQFLPLHQRYQLLQPLMDDDVTSVRMEVATSLAGVPLDQVKPEQAEALLALFREYLDIQKQHLDMPGVQLQLGIFYAGRGDLPSAEAAYREAIYLNPQLIPALLNLADLLRAQQRDEEARSILQTALNAAPEHGATLHALGLLETRTDNKALALDYLRRAAERESVGTRHRFVYAIALHDLDDPELAIKELLALLRVVPQSVEVLLALANYHAELGQRDKARGFALRLTQLAPNNRDYQALLKKVSR